MLEGSDEIGADGYLELLGVQFHTVSALCVKEEHFQHGRSCVLPDKARKGFTEFFAQLFCIQIEREGLYMLCGNVAEQADFLETECIWRFFPFCDFKICFVWRCLKTLLYKKRKILS